MGAIATARLTEASRRIVEAAVLGESWADPLDAFAHAAGAEGATLVGEGGRQGPVILATSGVAEGVAAYLAGRAPPDARLARVHPTLACGFRTDFDDFSPREIARDPFYVDFLRRYGLGWHATALLADASDGAGRIFLGLKRSCRRSHYEPEECAALAAALPALREAAHIARMRFNGERKPFALAYGDDERGVFAIDGRGLARPLNEAAQRLLGVDLTLRGGRLAAHSAEADARLQALLAAALAPPRRGAATIVDAVRGGRRLILRAVALDGAGRDLFAADAALLLVEHWRRPGGPSPATTATLREAFGLTPAEAKVAALIADGAALPEIARRLAISPGTARNHLKSGMAKAGAPRQAEFALLCGRLRA
ncbi:MAG: helix-turn-helix transcriptional regulator [Rhizobiales bacterium]|nr:helix-turn-helix transcriptional regulator [Hyphomicrobiales bacterium]